MDMQLPAAALSGCSLWDHARGYKYRQSILHDRFRNAGKLDRRTDCLFPDRRDYGDVYVMAGRKYFQYACTGIGAFTDSAGVEEGTPEGDIISTLGIGVSVIVNLIVLVLAVFFGQQVISSLPADIQVAFKFILPAVFGAILANFALRDYMLGLFALVMSFVLTTLQMPSFIVLPVCVFGTIAVGIWKFKRKQAQAAK